MYQYTWNIKEFHSWNIFNFKWFLIERRIVVFVHEDIQFRIQINKLLRNEGKSKYFTFFPQSVPKQLKSLLYNFIYIFWSRYLINLKKQFWKRSHPIHDFDRRLGAQTFSMSQMNPNKFVHNTACSVQPPYIAGHSLEKKKLAKSCYVCKSRLWRFS